MIETSCGSTKRSKKHNQTQHVLWEGVRIAADLAFPIRNERETLASHKATEVGSAAIASAIAELLLGTDHKTHPLMYGVVSLVEQIIINKIVNSTIKL